MFKSVSLKRKAYVCISTFLCTYVSADLIILMICKNIWDNLHINSQYTFYLRSNKKISFALLVLMSRHKFQYTSDYKLLSVFIICLHKLYCILNLRRIRIAFLLHCRQINAKHSFCTANIVLIIFTLSFYI